MSCNLEIAQGAVEEAEGALTILQTYSGDLAHGGAPLTAMLKTLAERSSTSVALQLDHGAGLEMIAGRLCDGYSSVMLDWSHLDENIRRQTRRLAEVAHASSASLEAEIELFGGDHGSVVFTDPTETERFVSESGPTPWSSRSVPSTIRIAAWTWNIWKTSTTARDIRWCCTAGPASIPTTWRPRSGWGS